MIIIVTPSMLTNLYQMADKKQHSNTRYNHQN